ncbi:hypothetical protein JAAARDRAFT_43796 [Jaapia argillacea MUCL 33604]|uniref:Uncharacterized protein n=1 Tax=Jaapia argillacea MUCL 33604 TaxID=933084 RepID=A0A067QDF6_9AGAM|nr:hypothetical protein JAAARDRAFT_43796 [Jaapia argillacea MUCL 33604]
MIKDSLSKAFPGQGWDAMLELLGTAWVQSKKSFKYCQGQHASLIRDRNKGRRDDDEGVEGEPLNKKGKGTARLPLVGTVLVVPNMTKMKQDTRQVDSVKPEDPFW